MDFRIRQLECFLTLADLLHYGRTARALYMSQPTITFQIKSLEQAFGVSLFERSRQQVHLTPAGVEFRTYAQTIVDTVRAAKLRLGERQSRFNLRISCGTLGQAILLPTLLRALSQEHPGFSLEVSELTTCQQMTGLPEGKVDALLMVEPLPLKGLRFDCLREEPLVAILPRTCALASRRTVSVNDLRETSLVVPRLQDSPLRQPYLNALLAPYGIAPRFIEAPHSFSAQLAYVAAGEGVIIGTRFRVPPRSSDVVARPFREQLPPLQLGLASMSSNVTPAMATFRELVLTCVGRADRRPPHAVSPATLTEYVA